jgi:hypothetical protein
MALDTYNKRSEMCVQDAAKIKLAETKARTLAERHGFTKLGKRRTPELSHTDLARGRALDRRVRGKLLGF